MSTGAIVAIVIAVILVAAIVALYFFGKRAQKRQEEQQVQLDAMKQTVTMLIIDKKRMKLNEAGLPQAVMSLICDEKIFDNVPTKKEVKASVSGIYVTEVKGLHGKTAAPEQKKKGFFKELVAKAQEKAGAKMVK